MKPLYAALSALLFVTPAAIGHAPGVLDRNVDFLLAFTGHDAMPKGRADVHTAGGVAMLPLDEAFRQAAARAGDVDLAAVVASASPVSDIDRRRAAGEVWLLEAGFGDCPWVYDSGIHVPGSELAPQARVQEGPLGRAKSHGPGMLIDMTTKLTLAGSYARGVDVEGASDWYCLSFFGTYFWFPQLFGTVHEHPRIQ